MAASWIHQLDRDGYAIVREVANAGTVDTLCAAFKDAERQHEAIQRDGAVYATRGALELAAVRQWALSDSALGLARRVLGAGARPVRGILFDKRPEANWPVAWHQDLTIAVRERVDQVGYGPWSVKAGVPHVQPPASVLEQMVTLRLHLDDCPASNGALRVLPESHQLGKLDRDQIREMVSAGRPRTCEANTGDAVLMRPLLLHSSGPSDAPHHRRVVHIEYAAAALDHELEWAESHPVILG